MANSSKVPSADTPEAILEPGLPIVDAHHHLWFRSKETLHALGEAKSISARAMVPTVRRHARYLFDEYLTDIQTGHNVVASVFMESRVMYRATGPMGMRSVGEVEFANGVAAMSASGNFGEVRICAGIVGGGVDLTLGDEVRGLLESRISAAGGRFRGIRAPVSFDPDPEIFGMGVGSIGILLDEGFRVGFRHLGALQLSFDAFVLEPQLPELIDLARAFPETRIILNHLGTPVGVGQYAGRREERFPVWRENIRALSKCPGVSVKLGGIGMHFAGFEYGVSGVPVTSEKLAVDWKPYVETCIEAFGASRCMFESNFPVDSATCAYPVVWNTFKRITRGASKAEKAALYAGTAAEVYRLDLS